MKSVVKATQSTRNASHWKVMLSCGCELWLTTTKEPKRLHCVNCETVDTRDTRAEAKR